jgi:hypothetical protein
MQGPVRIVPYPEKLDDARSADSQLPWCNYFFVVGLKGSTPAYPPFHPLDHLHGWTRMVLVANLEDNTMVAALFARTGERDEQAE